MLERRTRYRRPCPIPGCDWWQTTAWFVGGSDNTEFVGELTLRDEAKKHLLRAHLMPEKQIFV